MTQLLIQADLALSDGHVAAIPHRSQRTSRRRNMLPYRNATAAPRLPHGVPIHAAIAPALVPLLASLHLLCSTAHAQLRESFESPTPTWTVAQADCGVKNLLQERSFRQSHTGSGSERIRLQLFRAGTHVYLTQPIGKAPVIAELAPSLWIQADKANLQLLVRVVYPRTTDPGTGRPVTSLLPGDKYTEVGTWQQLKVPNLEKLVARDAAARRLELKDRFSEREAYIDLVVLNAYSSPGSVELWIDDLEIEGYLQLGENIGLDSRPDPGRQDAAGIAADPRRGIALQGSLLLADGRPLMPRIIEHNGEPLEWLKSLGFNTVKLQASPSAQELKEAARLSLWLVAPPPHAVDQESLGSQYDRVLAWSLGSQLTGRDLAATRQLTDEIRAIDPRHQRPLVCGAAADLVNYSRLANLLLFEQPTLGTSFEMGAVRGWLGDRALLLRPGSPYWVGLPTHLPLPLREQVIQMSHGAAWNEDLDLAQMRLLVYSALAGGAKGIVFQSELPLHTNSNAGAFRADLLKLLNYELLLLEPWGADGGIVEPVETGDPSLQASLLKTERSRLLLLTRHVPAQQFVAGPPDARPVSIVVPGVPSSDGAYQVTLAGPRELRTKTTTGGMRVTIDEPDLATAVVITQDPLVPRHFKRILDESKLLIGRLRCDTTSQRLLTVGDIDRELTRSGHPLRGAADLLREAQSHLNQALRAQASGDFRTLHAACGKCDAALARVRRGYWEQTAGTFPSPASSPCIARFSTLPAHWKFADWMTQRSWGPNALAAGDMESLSQLLESGWKQVRDMPAGVQADVALSLESPHGGRTALRMHSWAESPREAPAALEHAPLWITSSPVPVRQGQMVRVHGWVQVPRPLAACREGLLIFDSLSGPALGERVFVTQGWREFTLYRAVPQNGDLTLTFALTGLGEAWLDDVTVSLINPDPIRESNAAVGELPR